MPRGGLCFFIFSRSITCPLSSLYDDEEFSMGRDRGERTWWLALWDAKVVLEANPEKTKTLDTSSGGCILIVMKFC
jgi:hypothetical protein